MNDQTTELPFLPLGSVVAVDKNGEELMIISRFAETVQNGQKGYFDYAAVRNALGLISLDEIYFFNRSNIEDIKFVGYISAREQLFQDNIEQFIKSIKLPNLLLQITSR
jgi:hypothetical protein